MRAAAKLFLSLSLIAGLSACSALRQGAGDYEKAAARNEAGQLIQPAAPSEGADASGGAGEAPVPAMTVTQVLNIEKAAKNLPRGLAGDSSNVAHIGDPIPPR
jgi:uncharacterized lipoprotein